MPSCWHIFLWNKQNFALCKQALALMDLLMYTIIIVVPILINKNKLIWDKGAKKKVRNHMVGWHFQCFGLIKLGDLAYKLCGSRKYPYPPSPPPRKTIGNSEWEGGFKGSNFQGVRGVHGKLFSKGWRMHIQNIESNVRSIWSTKTYLRTLFWNKSRYSWPLTWG